MFGGDQSLKGDGQQQLLKAFSMAASVTDEAPEPLALNDVRMTAAMKVLGITMEELTAAEPQPPPPRKDERSPRKVVPVSPNTTARRKDLWERKQKNLLAECEDLARGFSQKQMMKILAEREESQAQYTGLPESMETKLQTLRDQSQAEIQRVIEKEREKLQNIRACADRGAKMKKQVEAKRSEEHEKLLETMKVRQAKREKQAIALQAEVVKKREEDRKLIKKLNTAFKKVEEHKAKVLEEWEQVKAEHEEKIARVQERREATLIQTQEDMVEVYLDKEFETQKRLAKKREEEAEKAVKGEQTFLEKIEKSQRKLEAQQKKREDEFLEALERQKQARLAVQARNDEVVEKAKETLEKRFEKRDTILAVNRREKLTDRRKVLAKLKLVVGPDSPKRLNFLEKRTQKVVDKRETMDEIVQQNLERLQRQREHKQSDLLARIEEINSRVDRIHEDRSLALEQHTLVLKEAMVEKARMEEELRTMKVVAIPPQESEEKEKEAK